MHHKQHFQMRSSHLSRQIIIYKITRPFLLPMFLTQSSLLQQRIWNHSGAAPFSQAVRTAGNYCTVQLIPKKFGVPSEQWNNRFHLLTPALRHNLVPPPCWGRSPAPAQQFLTSAAFQMLREFWDTSPRLPDPPEKAGLGAWEAVEIIHQHFREPFGLLFLLQREVPRRGSTHLPLVRKERGRPILLGSRLPVGFSPRFNSRKCFRKY